VTVTSTFMAVLLAAGGGVIYHVSAKSVPRDAAPSLVLLVAYMTALAISGLAHVSLHMEQGHIRPSRLLHPGILGLGIGAAMIELGYLLAYRAAWPVSVTSVVVNSMVAAVLIPVGLMAFGEHVSVTRIAGMMLCLTGLWLLLLRQ
jgi:drug/metabolite transporter (DMT)-like permease